MPLLQPAFATSIVLNLIGGLKLFDVIKVMTNGGPPGYSTQSVSTLIGKVYFDNQAAGYSAAMGVVLFLVIVLFTVVLNGALNRRRSRRCDMTVATETRAMILPDSAAPGTAAGAPAAH